MVADLHLLSRLIGNVAMAAMGQFGGSAVKIAVVGSALFVGTAAIIGFALTPLTLLAAKYRGVEDRGKAGRIERR